MKQFSVSRLTALGALMAVMLLPDPSAAQHRQDNPLVGRRVRITAPLWAEHKIVGSVTHFDDQDISILEEGSGQQYHLPLEDVLMYEPFKGDSRASTAWFNARLGGFIGVSLGAIAAPFLARKTDMELGQLMALTAGSGAVAGGSAGALIGFTFPRERWTWVVKPWGYEPSSRP